MLIKYNRRQYKNCKAGATYIRLANTRKPTEDEMQLTVKDT